MWLFKEFIVKLTTVLLSFSKHLFGLFWKGFPVPETYMHARCISPLKADLEIVWPFKG